MFTTFDNKKQVLDKKKGETNDGRILDYKSQREPIGERIIRDLADAYIRCEVACAGLCQLYWYDYQTQRPLPGFNETDEFGPIDACVIWVRDAIRWLVAFSQLDQEWSLSLSLRKLVDDEEKWAKVMTEQNGTHKLLFWIPADLFNSHTHVRLRGISAFAETQVTGPSFPWTVTVGLPKDAVTRQLDQNDTIMPKPVDQKDLPSCRLGRIQSRYDPRPPEVAGAVSLMNACPIGKEKDATDSMWWIEIVPPHNEAQSFADLEDLELELRLTGRPIIPS